MEKLINLSFINTLDHHIKANKGLLQVILGPRQVGKTTTVLKFLHEHYKKESLYVSADQAFNASAAWITEHWNKAQADGKILVIDEIQKCENWSEAIKGLYDESKRNQKKIRCVLLGSSSLQIQKGLTESLTGRYQLIPAYHWNFAESELGYNLTFDEYLKFGGYPGSYQFRDSREWESYVKNSIVATVIEKDILQYQNVKSPALFKQAFEILTAYPAQEISYTKLLGQLQDKGNVDLIKYYLQLYEGAFLFKVLEKYSNKTVLTKASSPKILPMAPCLYYLNILDDYSAEEKGRVFEMLVGTQLVRTNEKLYYWREGANEVDFVLKRGRHVWGIEVKSGRKKSFKGLDAFKKQFKEVKLVVIDQENYFDFEKDPLSFLEKYG